MTQLHLTDSLKMLRETLCVAQTALGLLDESDRIDEHISRLGRIIDEIDRQRPLAANGTHGSLHTPTCGCETAPTPEVDLHEQLAAIEHDRWTDWQRYLHSRCIRHWDGALIIPPDLVIRWERQIATPYADLSEQEKASDREQVDRYWPLIERRMAAERAVIDAARVWRECRAIDSLEKAGLLTAAVDALGTPAETFEEAAAHVLGETDEDRAAEEAAQ